MGPGTHIVNNIQQNVRPVNKNDFVAMLHDVDYHIHSGNERKISLADQRAIQNSDFNASGLILKTGLYLRNKFGLSSFHKGGDKRLGLILKNRIKNNPVNQDDAKKYNIDLASW